MNKESLIFFSIWRKVVNQDVKIEELLAKEQIMRTHLESLENKMT